MTDWRETAVVHKATDRISTNEFNYVKKLTTLSPQQLHIIFLPNWFIPSKSRFIKIPFNDMLLFVPVFFSEQAAATSSDTAAVTAAPFTMPSIIHSLTLQISLTMCVYVCV